MYPEELDYMVDWIYELHGRSGATMGGIAPLSYTVIESWARLMGIEGLMPYEIEGLIYLDSVMLEDLDKKEEEPPDEPPPGLPPAMIPWPSKDRHRKA